MVKKKEASEALREVINEVSVLRGDNAVLKEALGEMERLKPLFPLLELKPKIERLQEIRYCNKEIKIDGGTCWHIRLEMGRVVLRLEKKSVEDPPSFHPVGPLSVLELPELGEELLEAYQKAKEMAQEAAELEAEIGKVRSMVGDSLLREMGLKEKEEK